MVIERQPSDRGRVRLHDHHGHAMGTNIHGVLLFAWVLLFRKLVVTARMGTNIHGVLVIDGYLTPDSTVYLSAVVDMVCIHSNGFVVMVLK